MKHTTHKLTTEQKEALFTKHKTLIHMIFCCGGYMLRKQIRKLYHLLTGVEEKETEFMIAELITSGFLLQKTINKDTRTQMLYLSKYPKSIYLDIDRTGNVPALSWTTPKIMEQIFKIDYMIEKIIPDMQAQGFQIDMDNILVYFQWKGSNLFLSSNQTDMVTFYTVLGTALQDNGFTLSDDFLRDMEISQYDKSCFEVKQLKKERELPPCPAKIQRAMEMDSYNNEIEKNKYFYSLKNLASHGFYVEKAEGNIIYLCLFDSMNSLQTKKLYQQLSYILMMFQRYLNNYSIELGATCYVWDSCMTEHLKQEECKNAFDFYRQEWVEENKKNKIMKDIGLLPQYWDYIHVTYVSEEIYSKYNVHL